MLILIEILNEFFFAKKKKNLFSSWFTLARLGARNKLKFLFLVLIAFFAEGKVNSGREKESQRLRFFFPQYLNNTTNQAYQNLCSCFHLDVSKIFNWYHPLLLLSFPSPPLTPPRLPPSLLFEPLKRFSIAFYLFWMFLPAFASEVIVKTASRPK